MRHDAGGAESRSGRWRGDVASGGGSRRVRSVGRGVGRGAARRALAGALVAVVLLGQGACASLARHATRPLLVGADGQELPERALRATLAANSWDAARAHAGSPRLGGPTDEVLRALYAGTVAYYAGRFDESAAALDRAAALSDDRYTKSVSRGALAIATNDRALPYVPGQTERLFVPYYAMLGFLKQGDAEGAAVEARRLAFLLQQYDERRDSLDVSTRAVLRYLTGAAFEAAGERNDADVAYRNAAALLGGALPAAVALGPPPAAGRRGRAPEAAPTGEVIVVVEQGFVAHRVSEAMYLELASDGERQRFADRDRAWDHDPALGRAIARLSGDAGLWAGEPRPVLALGELAGRDSALAGEPPADAARDGGVTLGASMDADGVARRSRAEQRTLPPADATRVHVPARRPGSSAVVTWSGSSPTFRLAWPAYRRTGARLLDGAVFVRDADPLPADGDDATHGPVRVARGAPRGVPAARAAARDTNPRTVVLALRADVSDAVAADLKRDRVKLLSRLVARAAARAALLAQARRKSRDLGDVLASASRVVEQADTRSWHLLPASLGVARLRLPVGRHALVARVDGRDLPVGEVDVVAGGVTIVAARAWSGAPAPAPRVPADRI